MSNLPGGMWGFLFISMLLIFILGFFLDFLQICFIVIPILAPIANQFGIDLLWFAILIAINLQTSFFNTAIWLLIILSQGGCTTRSSITGHLFRHHPVCTTTSCYDYCINNYTRISYLAT